MEESNLRSEKGWCGMNIDALSIIIIFAFGYWCGKRSGAE